MTRLFRLDGAVERDPAIDTWRASHRRGPGADARRWFDIIRHCGDDVRECLHDGQPTACVDGVAFAYVDVFRNHANIGFFHGAELADPQGLLEGSGKFMRHVKLRPDRRVDDAAVAALIEVAYGDVKVRLLASRQPPGTDG